MSWQPPLQDPEKFIVIDLSRDRSLDRKIWISGEIDIVKNERRINASKLGDVKMMT